MYGGKGGESDHRNSRFVSKNMSNAEYIEHLAQQNRLSKERVARSKDRQNQLKLQEREQGFNVFLSGANEARVAEQRLKEKFGSINHGTKGSSGAAFGVRAVASTIDHQSTNVSGRIINQRNQRSRSKGGIRGGSGAPLRSDSKGARRRWLAPESGTNHPGQQISAAQDNNSKSKQGGIEVSGSFNVGQASSFVGQTPQTEAAEVKKQANYHNPFDLGESSGRDFPVYRQDSASIPFISQQKSSSKRPQNMPSGKRKGWGVEYSQVSPSIQSNHKSLHQQAQPAQSNQFNLDESVGFSVDSVVANKPQEKPVFSGANFLDPSSPEEENVRKQINLPVRYTKVYTEAKKLDQQVQPPTKSKPIVVADEDESNYSDNFEEINMTVQTVQNGQIEDLLKTATEEQLAALQQSLSNWQDAMQVNESSFLASAKSQDRKQASGQQMRSGKALSRKQQTKYQAAQGGSTEEKKGIMQQQVKNRWGGNNSQTGNDDQPAVNIIDEDEYIEEDFEEDRSESEQQDDEQIIEDRTGEDQLDESTNNQNDDLEERLLKERRLQQEHQRNQLNKNNAITATVAAGSKSNRVGGSRPISATYNLATGLKQAANSKNQTIKDRKEVLSALEAENRQIVQQKRPAASARPYYPGPGKISSNLPTVKQLEETKKSAELQAMQQANSTNTNQQMAIQEVGVNVQQTFDTNPFRRPISHVQTQNQKIGHLSGELQPQLEEKTQDADKPKVDRQNFMTSSEKIADSWQKDENSKTNREQRKQTPYVAKMDETGFSRDNEIIDSQGTGIVGSTTVEQPSNVAQQDQGGNGANLMSSLLFQICSLEDSQRHQLLKVLKNLDQSGDISGKNLQDGLKQFLQPASISTNPQLNHSEKIKRENKPDIIDKFGSDQAKSVVSAAVVKNSSPKQERKNNEIVIKILSTLGNPHVCGLTEIELFDEKAQKIALSASCILIKNQGKGPKIPVEKLISGKKLTKDEKQMWLGYLPLPPQKLQISINVSKDVQVAGMKIWNYNKGILDCTKGVQELEILSNGELKWAGSLQPGRGHIDKDYSKQILIGEILPNSFKLPKEPIPDQQSLAIQTNDEDKIQQNVNMSQVAKKNVVEEQTKSTKLLPPSTQNNYDSYDEKKELTQAELLQKHRSQIQLSKHGVLGGQKSQAQLQKVSDKPIWFDKSVSDLDKSVKPSKELEKRKSQFRQTSQEKQEVSQQISKTHIEPQKIENSPEPPQIQTKKANNSLHQQENDEINQAVKNALDSVNQAIQFSTQQEKVRQNSRIRGNTRKDLQQVQNQQARHLVDESLDSLDYFKVTNLGRFGNQDNASTTKQKSRIAQKFESRNGAVGTTIQNKYGAESPANIYGDHNQGSFGGEFKEGRNQKSNAAPITNSIHDMSRDSIRSSGSRRIQGGGPQLVKSPFPDAFASPSASGSSKRGPKKIQGAFGMKDQGEQMENFDQNESQKQTAGIKQSKNAVDDLLENIIQEDSYSLISEQEDNLSQLATQEVKISSEISNEKEESDCLIPHLPRGRDLSINITETWGDMNYLGLTGIEVFDEKGKNIKFRNAQISAFPPDVNVLPGYGTDPRTVENLIDGHNFTQDDLHVWLTPFTSGEDHTITLLLGQETTISMIRIWNYNKSRIHSFRGAKTVSIKLNDAKIFSGEIRKAPGMAKDPEQCCEVILFTENETILDSISGADWLNELNIDTIMDNDFEDTQRITSLQIGAADIGSGEQGMIEQERPMTATKRFTPAEIEDLQFQLQQQQHKPTSLFDERPQTSAIVDKKPSKRLGEDSEQDQPKIAQSTKNQGLGKILESKKSDTTTVIMSGQVIDLNITETWGDLFYVGLNGIEVLDEFEGVIPVTCTVGQLVGGNKKSLTKVEAQPRDMNSIPGHASDHRTLEKLFNGQNNTSDDRNMWLIPFNKGENHTMSIDLGQKMKVSGLRFFNYNKSPEDTLRGVKQIVIKLDGEYVTSKKGVTLRVAPGCVHGAMDIGQTVSLGQQRSIGWTNVQIVPVQRSLAPLQNQLAKPLEFHQEYDAVAMPLGLSLRINLYSTHGDLFYIGLNGLEVFDQLGEDVLQKRPPGSFKISAFPSGVHSLKGMESDIRFVENIGDGTNSTPQDEHCWLTPYRNTKGHQMQSTNEEKDLQARREPNFILIHFEEPVAFAALRLWNYAKTPTRGVNEFEVEIDGLKAFRGFARPCPDSASFAPCKDKGCTSVIFDASAVRQKQDMARQILFDPAKRQNVLLMNESKLMNQQKASQRVNEKFVFDEQERPKTKALHLNL